MDAVLFIKVFGFSKSFKLLILVNYLIDDGKDYFFVLMSAFGKERLHFQILPKHHFGEVMKG